MVKKSATEQLAADIEMLTGACWGREQRLEVAEMIRKYRFHQVTAVLARVSRLVHDSGDFALSEKIYMGHI